MKYMIPMRMRGSGNNKNADGRGQRYDPKQNASVTIGSNYMPWRAAQLCADIVKVSYNYAEVLREASSGTSGLDHLWRQTASVVQSRGIYHFPFEKSILADDDEQCSSLGNSSTSWGRNRRRPAFWQSEICPSRWDGLYGPDSIILENLRRIIPKLLFRTDRYGNLQEGFLLYLSATWTDHKTKPMVHLAILGFQRRPNDRFSHLFQCAKRRVRLNGESIGKHDIDHAHGKRTGGLVEDSLCKGELKAIAYDEAGRIVAEDTRTSLAMPSVLFVRIKKN